MIKYVKVATNKVKEVRPVDFSIDGVIKYIGQSGTSGYASAAKGYLADYVLRNIPVTWSPLYFDNSKNDKHYYVDALAESVIDKSYSKYDRLIIHSTPDLWQSTVLQHKHIDDIVGYCAWETSKLPTKWVDHINMVNQVWVPSVFNKQSFIESGVKTEIKVVPHIWHPQQLIKKSNIKIYDYCRTEVSSDKYTFYSIGELNFRKGIEDLVTVFDKLNDTYKDTQLILKLHYKDYSQQSKEYCISKLRSLTNKIGTDIFLIFENLTNQEVLALHSFGDCYVSLNKGEGFGLTIFDAFNYGKKVVTTGYGGQVDFLKSHYNGLVKYKIDKVIGMDKFSTNYSVDQEWAYPDLEHAYELMLYFYENQI
jgi:glycosyltransferase involved in cell wall biosynthesis